MTRVIKSIFLAGTMSGLIATGALAADLPDNIAAPDLLPVPVTASAYDWTGAYVGLNIGGVFGGDFDNNIPVDLGGNSGLLLGGNIGYNHQIDKFVVGLEADVNYATPQGEVGTLDADLNLLGTATARLGYTPVDRLLTYVEGGYAFGVVEIAVPGLSDSNFHNGFAVGAGAEYAITDNILSGLEYNYVSLADQDFNVGAGINSAEFSGHTVKFNVKYKF